MAMAMANRNSKLNSDWKINFPIHDGGETTEYCSTSSDSDTDNDVNEAAKSCPILQSVIRNRKTKKVGPAEMLEKDRKRLEYEKAKYEKHKNRVENHREELYKIAKSLNDRKEYLEDEQINFDDRVKRHEEEVKERMKKLSEEKQKLATEFNFVQQEKAKIQQSFELQKKKMGHAKGQYDKAGELIRKISELHI